MGKDLKGKELGVGICQRKDGLYTARFTGRDGKRRQKYFKKLQECRKWIADAQFDDEHGNINASGDMTVDAWFDYWIKNIKGATIKYNTLSNYTKRFNYNISQYIGKMLLSDVKPMHCQNVLNQMASSGYKNTSIKLTRITMNLLFDDAVENGLIVKNPVTKTVKCTQGEESPERNAITREEQSLFFNAIRKSGYYAQFALVLQTGLRVGELSGLKWSDIDFENKRINVCRTMTYRDKQWRVNTPKSKAGFREVPLTEEALRILKGVKEKRSGLDVIPMQYHDTVFLSKNGIPILPTTYNNALRSICKRTGIPQISMHILRHTFATRCIEAGMQPKTLQEILGHASIEMTMDIYVHVMKDTKLKEMSEIESALMVM